MGYLVISSDVFGSRSIVHPEPSRVAIVQPNLACSKALNILSSIRHDDVAENDLVNGKAQSFNRVEKTVVDAST